VAGIPASPFPPVGRRRDLIATDWSATEGVYKSRNDRRPRRALYSLEESAIAVPQLFWIRVAMRQLQLERSVMVIDIVKKMDVPIFSRDNSHIEDQHRNRRN
jgi:hypothetical protein